MGDEAGSSSNSDGISSAGKVAVRKETHQRKATDARDAWRGGSHSVGPWGKKPDKTRRRQRIENWRAPGGIKNEKTRGRSSKKLKLPGPQEVRGAADRTINSEGNRRQKEFRHLGEEGGRGKLRGGNRK